MTVRFGLLSAANIANTFCRDIAHVEGAEVVAVAARDHAKAQAFAETHKIPRAYQGYERLFDDPDIDALYIATPHNLHAQFAERGLRAGKAVLVEKPICTSLAELDALLETAAECKVLLMEAMWTWCLPAIAEARRWVEAGRIGELRHIRADFGFPMPYDAAHRCWNPELAGGALLDMGIYPIALVRYFLARAPERIEVVTRLAPTGVDAEVSVLQDYGDVTAMLATSFTCQLTNHASLIGTAGRIEIPEFWGAAGCELWEGSTKVDSFSDDRSGSGFEFQIAEFCRAFHAGEQQTEQVPHGASRDFQADMDRIREQMPVLG